MIKNAFFIEFLRKYRGKYSEKQQKNGKFYFFIEKKLFEGLFCMKKQIFFVFLRPKADMIGVVGSK